jgi:hypothetical protein
MFLSKVRNFFSKLPIIIGLILVVFLLISIFITNYLAQKKQEVVKSKAAEAAPNYNATLSLSPKTVNVEPGKTIDTPISVSLNTNGESAVAADISIAFDPSKLTLIDLTKEVNSVFKTYLPLDASNNFDKNRIISKANSNGLIEFGLISFDVSANNGNGAATGTVLGIMDPVSRLTFQAKSGVTGATNILFKFSGLGSFSDSNVIINATGTDPQDVLAEPTSVVLVNIAYPTPTPTPTATPSPTPTPTITPYPTPTPMKDTVAPTVRITSPANGATVNRYRVITLTAAAYDNVGVTKVEFYVNNSLRCTDKSTPYNCSWYSGSKRYTKYTIKAKVYDKAGNIGQSNITITTK